MYDSHVGNSKFSYYRKVISNIYNGEDVKTSVRDLERQIDLDYANGKLSSSQYDNIMSLLMDL